MYCLYVTMLLLFLCPVMLGSVLTLTIDSHLGTSIEDCFDRISIGEQLKSVDIYRNVTELTIKECEQICKQDKQCQSYDYGVGAKGNATCDLSKLDEKEIKEKNILHRNPDYDVYVRRFNCEQAPPTPIIPLADDSPGPQHRPVFRPDAEDGKRPVDYPIDLRPFETGRPGYYPSRPSIPSYNQIDSDRPDDYDNLKPNLDRPPSYGAHRPQEIPFRPERPQNGSRPGDILYFDDYARPPRPNDQPHRPKPRPDLITENKPNYYYILRPNRKPYPDEPGYRPPKPVYPTRPDTYQDDPYRPRPERPIYNYDSQYASNYGSSHYQDNTIYLEIYDPPSPYRPPNRPYGGSHSDSQYGPNYNNYQKPANSYRPQRPHNDPGPGYGGSDYLDYSYGSRPQRPYSDQFGSTQSSYNSQSSQSSYGSSQSSYGSSQSSTERPQSSYGSSQNPYGSQSQSYGGSQSSYGSQNQASTTQQYGSQSYGSNQYQSSSSQASYGSSQSSTTQNYGSQSYGGSLSSSQYGTQSSQSGYGTRPSIQNDRPGYGSSNQGYGESGSIYELDSPSYSNRPTQNDNSGYGSSSSQGYGSQSSSQYGSSQYGSTQSSQSGYDSRPTQSDRPSYGSSSSQGYGSQSSSQYGSNQYDSSQSSQSGYGNRPSQNDRPLYDSSSNQGYVSQSSSQYDSSQSGYGNRPSQNDRPLYDSSSNQGYGSQSNSQYGSSQSGYGNRPSQNDIPGYGSSSNQGYGGNQYGSSQSSSQYGSSQYGSSQSSQSGYGNSPIQNDRPYGSGSNQGSYGQSNDQYDSYNQINSGSQYGLHLGYGSHHLYGIKQGHYGNQNHQSGNHNDRPNSQKPGYGQKPLYDDQTSPGYGQADSPADNQQSQKPGQVYPKPGNQSSYAGLKPVYEDEYDKPADVPSYIVGVHGEIITSRPVAVGDYDRPGYGREPGPLATYKACFRRVLAGRRALRSHVRRVVDCERLEDCRRECATERRFHCESFNYRLDSSFRGKGLCELMTKPIEAFDLREDFVDDKDYDFYEVDRNSLEPNCPETLRGPGLLHSGFLSSKPGSEDRRLQSRYDDRRYNSNRRQDERFVPYQIGVSRGDDSENWGQYGGVYGSYDKYYKDRNDFHKSINHWRLADKTSRTTSDFDYGNLGKSRWENYGTHGKNRWEGYGWKHKWNSSWNGVDSGESFYRGSHLESEERSDEPHVKDCSSRRRPGMSLGSGAIRRSLHAHNVVECEAACFSEREFKCVSYSFKYSSGHTSDNCFLSERPYRGLEMSADSASDVYAMPQDQGCHSVSRQPLVESECFWHVRSGSAVSGSAVKAALTVTGLGACEAECIRAHNFFCRGFSFRFDSPTIGDDLENCLLTSTPPTSLAIGRGLRPTAGHEMYARGNYGRGCEPALYDDTQHKDTQCYLRYDSAAKLTGNSIRGSARVADETACGKACTDAPFRCLSFSYSNNASPGVENCLLSEVRLFDLQRGVDYEHSTDDWLFAFDIFNGQCWRKVHGREFDTPTLEIPKPFYGTSDDDYPSGPPELSGPSGPSGASGPSGPSGPSGSRPDSYPEPPFASDPIGLSAPGSHIPKPYIQDYRPYPISSPGYKPVHDYPKPIPDYPKPINDYPKPIHDYPKPINDYPKPIRDYPKPEYKPDYPRPVYSDPYKPGYLPSGPDTRPSYGPRPETGYRPRPEPSYRPGAPGYGTEPLTDKGDIEATSVSWRHYTVSGFPCRSGTTCAQNVVAGHWACEPEGGEVGSWDYCCAPTHRCGYSEGIRKPWCYVGPEHDQWRPCSEKYYPYHQHKVPHPSQTQGTNRPSRPHRERPNFPDRPYLPESDRKYWDDLYRDGPQAYYDKYGNPLPGYTKVPTEERPHIRYQVNPPRPGSGQWVPVPSLDNDDLPTGELGVPRYWPVAYLHRGPPPNMTYFRYNETTTTTEKNTPFLPTPESNPDLKNELSDKDNSPPNDVEARNIDNHRDDKGHNITDEDRTVNITTTSDKIVPIATEKINTTQEIENKVNESEIEATKSKNIEINKELDIIKGIDDKLQDFTTSIEVYDIEDAKGDKIPDVRTLEAEERQIEAIGRLLASRRGGKLVIEKRSEKELGSKNIALDKDLVDFNFGNKFPTTERRGIIQKVSKDEIERERASNDQSLEVSETSYFRPPPRVLITTTESIRKAIVNGKVFYDASVREQRDFFSNSTRKAKSLRLEDSRGPSVLPHNNTKKNRTGRQRPNPVRRVRRVYRKRYNPEEVRKRLLEREKSKNNIETAKS